MSREDLNAIKFIVITIVLFFVVVGLGPRLIDLS